MNNEYKYALLTCLAVTISGSAMADRSGGPLPVPDPEPVENGVIVNDRQGSCLVEFTLNPIEDGFGEPRYICKLYEINGGDKKEIETLYTSELSHCKCEGFGGFGKLETLL